MKSDEQGLLGQQQVSQAEHSAISEGPEASDDAKRNTATSQKKIEANRQCREIYRAENTKR